MANDVAGWAELIEQLRDCSIVAIGIEASGGYERGAMRALLAADLPVRQVNPSSFDSSLGRAGFWPRAIHSMLA